MNYFLTEEQQEIKELAAEIADDRVVAIREHHDETGEFPWDIMKLLAQSDLFGVWLPEEYGGLGGGVFDLCLVTEQLSRACGGVAVTYAGSALGAIPILLAGSDEQKQKYLPDIASGAKLAAFGLTEANAGSDAGNMRTTAVRDGDDYIINGTKQWITNGGEAEVYTVIAITNPEKGPRGSTAFIVDKDTPGFTFGKKENKLGIRTSATRELVFQDCRVPAANVLKREGYGFVVALQTLDRSRPGVAAQALGIAQGAMEASVKYAHEREQFGQKIAEFQAVGHMLADMAIEIEASRALIYAVARAIDDDPTMKDTPMMSAMTKCFASDVAMKVTTNAVQVFGGYGYMKEYPVEKMMRDAKITQIYEGTNQVQRNVIAAGLTKTIR